MLANFSNLITFSRGSNATLTDASGRLTYAPNNLVTNSQDFEASAWTKLNGGTGSLPVVTANSAVAPDGTTTADTIVFSQGASQTVNDFSLVRQTGFSLSGIASIYLRANAATTVKISADDITYTVCNVTTQWQRFFVFSSSATRLSFGLRETGTGTSATVFAWGAQLEAVTYQTTPSPYVSTSVANLLGFSEDFTNAVWTKSNCSVVIGMDQNPINNLWNAQKLMVDTATAIHRVAGAATVNVISGVRYTLSIYAKAAGTRYLYMNYAAQLNAASTFDLQTGTVSATASGTASIVSVGNGWYRCSVTGTAPATAGSTFYLQLNDTGVASDRSYTGDGNSGIYIYGAQLSNSGSLDPYVPTPGAAPSSTAYYGPRYDYDPVTLAAKGILIEEARTNLALTSAFQTLAGSAGSQYPSGAGWSNLFNTGGTRTYVPSSVFSGGQAVDISSVSAARNVIAFSFTPAASTTYTVSFYIESVSGATGVVAYTTGSLGTGGTTNNISAPTTTGRYTYTFTTGTTPGSVDLRFGIGCATNESGSIRISNVQCEAGAFATSYIPTVASQVTRSADVASITGSLFNGWYNQNEGAWVASWSPYAVTGSIVAQISAATNNDRFQILNDNSSQVGITTGGVGQGGVDAGTVNAGAINKLAFAYRTNDVPASLNGGAVVSDTTVTLPVVDRLCIGATVAPAGFLCGHIQTIEYIPNAISTNQVQWATS